MVCKNCGKEIPTTPKRFAIINGTAMVICEKCMAQYTEDEMSQSELEELYWGKENEI